MCAVVAAGAGVARRVWAFLLLSCLLPVCVQAQELTPLERAMRALAKKQRAADMALANSSEVKAPTVSSPAATGNSAAAFFANPLPAGSVVMAQANTLPASRATEAPPAPLAPADPLELTGTATAETINLSWSNTGTAWKGFAGYMVSRAKAGEEPQPLLNAPLAVAAYRDVSVTPKTTYAYRVTALESSGQTLAASRMILQRLLASVPPETPYEPDALVDDERVRLTWKPVQPTSHAISGYVVYRSRLDGSDERPLNAGRLTEKPEYYDASGKPNEEYLYRVATVDSWGATSEATAGVKGRARPRSRNGLVLMSTAYRGLGLETPGFNGDLQFTYFIGTLYGDQDQSISNQSLYLDPISLWLLTADTKYTLLTEAASPVSLALGGKATLQLFAGQQSATGGSFTFSGKSSFQTLWGSYLSLSKSFGDWGAHAGYLLGTSGDAVYFLSKYMEPAGTRNLMFVGFDFPILRRMNAAVELIVPLDEKFQSRQHPILLNTHVERLFNFDISCLRWDQGWALLGYFNLRFTLFPGSDR